ncbi:MAG: cupin domain-containing protein [Rubrivivax sp.]|nr:cupin domain-containing protein [Pyrinomonadaceae bacterium]
MMSSTKMKISATFVRSEEVEWQFSAPGVSKKVLYSDEQTGESALLLRFDEGATYPLHNHPGSEEIFALEGDVRVGKHELKAGDYLYTPPEGKHAVSSKNGCLVFLRLSKPIEILSGDAAQY